MPVSRADYPPFHNEIRMMPNFWPLMRLVVAVRRPAPSPRRKAWVGGWAVLMAFSLFWSIDAALAQTGAPVIRSAGSGYGGDPNEHFRRAGSVAAPKSAAAGSRPASSPATNSPQSNGAQGKASPYLSGAPQSAASGPEYGAYSGEYQTLPTMQIDLEGTGRGAVSPVSYRQNGLAPDGAVPGEIGDSNFPTPDGDAYLRTPSRDVLEDAMGAGPLGASAGNPYAVEPQQPVWDQEEAWSWHLVPEGLLYKSYIAGEKEPRMSTAFLYPSNGGETLWDSVLGGRVGLIRYGTARGIEPEGWQWDVEGGAFLRMLPQTERDVMSTDYRIGTPLTYREGPFQWKIGYYHISSHLGDKFLLKNPGYDRLNYSRDCVVTGFGYFPVPSVRTYFEFGYGFYLTDGAEPWEMQFGAEYSPTGPTGIRGTPFAACNVHLMEENDWGGSVNILVGWQWRGDTSDHTFRAGFQFYNGADNQLSFFGNTTQLTGFGIRYDY
jgi:hypothetical protein